MACRRLRLAAAVANAAQQRSREYIHLVFGYGWRDYIEVSIPASFKHSLGTKLRLRSLGFLPSDPLLR
jgi:hypothetical protein